VTALENGFTRRDRRRCAVLRLAGRGLGQKCFVNFDRRYAGPHTMRWGVEQSRNLMTVRVAAETRHAQDHEPRRRSASAIPQLPVDRARRRETRPFSAWSTLMPMLANQGRSVKPTTIDYVAGPHGKVIYRTDNRCAVMGNCNAPDWDGKAMPRPPSRTRSCSIRWPHSRWSTSWKA
jgi:penicillin-binding protein 1A